MFRKLLIAFAIILVVTVTAFASFSSAEKPIAAAAKSDIPPIVRSEANVVVAEIVEKYVVEGATVESGDPYNQTA